MSDTVQFRGKMPLARKRTRLGHFDVVRRPAGSITIEFLSEHLDEYRVRHFAGLAKDASEAVKIAEAFQSESNAGSHRQEEG